MDVERYPARYRDQWGEEETTIQNDGQELGMVLRNIEFHGYMLDDWEPAAEVDAAQLHLFTFSHGSLCGYTLEFTMPIPVIFQVELLAATLRVQLILGQPNAKGRLDHETLILTLDVAERSFVSQGTSGGWFENELLDIQRQLPEGMFMRTCLFCAFSAYHPVGNGLFGQLSCFRRAKREILAVKNKADLFALYDKKLDEQVQETYWCPEFTRRPSLLGQS